MKIETVRRINDTLRETEIYYLNKAGHIPLVSTVSGALRALLGLAEVVAGVALSIFAKIGKKDLSLLYGKALIGQGVLNLVRSVVEVIPFIGNKLTKIYDDKVNRLHSNGTGCTYRTRFEYPEEFIKPFPLNDPEKPGAIAGYEYITED